MKFNQHLLKLAAWAGLACLWTGAARGVEVEATRDDTFQQLAQGELKSMALTSDGYLVPSYERRQAGDTGNEIVWDALRGKDGTVLCATGHHGKLVRLGDEKTTRTVATVPEPELTALAPLKDGSVLVAAAPTGRIYRLSADDTLTTWTQLKAKFIWRLIPDRDGSIWAVTGTEGRLFRLRDEAGQAKVEEVAKFRSSNLLDLWVDQEGLLGTRGDVYVAGQNPGWLYRWSPDRGRTEVAYNPQAEEIRRLLPTAEGLALALNTERSPSSQALNLTLRMSGGGMMGPSMGSPSGPPMGVPPPPPDQSFSQTFAPSSQGGFGAARSEVVILDSSGFTRSLWQAPDRPIHDLALSPDKKILAAAGSMGRLYEIAMNGDYAMVADVREDYLMRIVPDDGGYLLAAARNGVVFDMGTRRAAEAVYSSHPMDAGKLVKWGHAYFRGDLAEGQQAELSFRLGNDGDPDSSFWEPWTKPAQVRPDQAIELPGGPARFMQYRLTFRQGGNGAKPPRMEYLDAFYIGRNAAPVIQQVTASEAAPMSPRASSPPPLPPPSSGSSSSSSGSSLPSGSSSSPSGSGQIPGGSRVPRSNPMSINVSWRVTDPNGDDMRYAVYFKGETENQWKLVEKDLTSTNLPLSVAGLADGHYRFRVVASDELDNPPGTGLKTEELSNEILVDNTPPAVENKAVTVDGRRATLTLDAADNISLIAAVRADLDNGKEYPLAPVDGVLDQQRESFRWQTEPLKPGEHVITISVTDARGNAAVDKVVFNISEN